MHNTGNGVALNWWHAFDAVFFASLVNSEKSRLQMLKHRLKGKQLGEPAPCTECGAG